MSLCRERHPVLVLADRVLFSSVVVCLSSSLGFCCLPKPLQMPGSLAPRGPPAASFAALLQTAYESEGALLDEQVQAQLRAALPHVPMPRLLCSAKHLLLYLRSTVENFGQVSAAPLSRRPRVSPHLCLQSGPLGVRSRRLGGVGGVSLSPRCSRGDFVEL